MQQLKKAGNYYRTLVIIIARQEQQLVKMNNKKGNRAKKPVACDWSGVIAEEKNNNVINILYTRVRTDNQR